MYCLFFKRRTTYEHPVSPRDPILYAEAFQRKGYGRAGRCESGVSEQYLFLKLLRNNPELTLLNPVPYLSQVNTQMTFSTFLFKPSLKSSLCVSETLWQIKDFIIRIQFIPDEHSENIDEIERGYKDC